MHRESIQGQHDRHMSASKPPKPTPLLIVRHRHTCSAALKRTREHENKRTRERRHRAIALLWVSSRLLLRVSARLLWVHLLGCVTYRHSTHRTRAFKHSLSSAGSRLALYRPHGHHAARAPNPRSDAGRTAQGRGFESLRSTTAARGRRRLREVQLAEASRTDLP